MTNSMAPTRKVGVVLFRSGHLIKLFYLYIGKEEL